MRAAVVTGFDRPLVLEDREVPEPGPVEAGDIDARVVFDLRSAT